MAISKFLRHPKGLSCVVDCQTPEDVGEAIRLILEDQDPSGNPHGMQVKYVVPYFDRILVIGIRD
jgi:hypothetical protein